MNKKNIILIFIFFLFPINPAFSDDAYLNHNFQSGNVFTGNNKHIRMQEEEVIYRNSTFECKFIFVNTSSKEQEVLMGFPVVGKINEHLRTDYPNRSIPDEAVSEFKKNAVQYFEYYYNFHCTVNGEEVTRELKRADSSDEDPYDYFYVMKIRFAPGEKKEIIDSYRQVPSVTTGGSGYTSTDIMYILSTGSTWAGPINKIAVKFCLSTEITNYLDCLTVPLSGKILSNRKERLNFFKINYGTEYSSQAVYKVKYIWFDGAPDDFTYYPDFASKSACAAWNYTKIKPDFDITFEIKEINCNDEYGNDMTNKFIELLASVSLTDPAVIPQKEIDEILKNYLFEGLELKKDKNNFFMFALGIGEYIAENHKKTGRDIAGLSRFFINALYARNGYKFSTKKWSYFFSNFDWYKPVPGECKFTVKEAAAIKAIESIEKGLSR